MVDLASLLNDIVYVFIVSFAIWIFALIWFGNDQFFKRLFQEGPNSAMMSHDLFFHKDGEEVSNSFYKHVRKITKYVALFFLLGSGVIALFHLI